MTGPEPAAVPPQAITAADLCRRWREQAAEWKRMADSARTQVRPDFAMATRREYRAEVYAVCADDLEAAAPHLAAYDPREFGLTASDLRAVADRLYDCADSRLDPMDNVSVRFGQIRSHLRGLADALDQGVRP